MLTQNQFTSILKQHSPLIIDGALASELETRGHDLNHPLWSAKILEQDPMLIKQVHLDYFLAGANIAITASYQASAAGFKTHFGFDEAKAATLIKRSATLARLALEESYGQGVRRDTPLLVAGSVGPYGAYLADGSEYRGEYVLTKAEFQHFHRSRIQALVDADVDLLAIETMPQYYEIEAVLELLRDEFPTACAWVSCTLRDAEHISDGTSVADVVKLLGQYRDTVAAFGFNCVPSDLSVSAVQHLRRLTDIPVLVYPNSGEEWDAVTKTWSDPDSDSLDLGAHIDAWQKAGAQLIGGCCRTGPAHIMAISGALKR